MTTMQSCTHHMTTMHPPYNHHASIMWPPCFHHVTSMRPPLVIHHVATMRPPCRHMAPRFSGLPSYLPATTAAQRTPCWQHAPRCGLSHPRASWQAPGCDKAGRACTGVSMHVHQHACMRASMHHGGGCCTCNSCCVGGALWAMELQDVCNW